jgi:hypothetical protein
MYHVLTQFVSGVSRVLHAHRRVQAVQGSLRQDRPEAPEERALFVYDPRAFGKGCRKFCF